MTKPSLSVAVAGFVAIVTCPSVSHAQAFKVDRFSIGGDGGTDYLTAEPGTGRVFVSRGTHVMVVDGATGKVLGDIPDTPRTHGIALAPKSHHGFVTNGGDSTVTMFDLKTLAVIKKIPIPTGGQDGIMYDDFSDRIILTNHSHPNGTLVALDPKTGDIVGTVELEDDGPEGAASDGKGKIFVNNEGKSTIQVIDIRAFKVLGPDGDRLRSRHQPDLLRLREDVGRGRRLERQDRRDDCERRRRRCVGVGPGAEIDLHPRRA
jgi:DNA-binding beta-propeller fold protein YncE